MADPRVTESKLVVDPATYGIIQGVHETSGLPGWYALDISAPSGSTVVAPESGTIERISGHDPSEGIVGPGGVFGYSEYLRGVSGQRYYLTHFGSLGVTENQHVRVGEPIGTIGDFPDHDESFNHVHWAVEGPNPEGVLRADYQAALAGGVTPAPVNPPGGSTPAPSIDPNTGLVVNPTNPATTPGSSSTGGGGVGSKICDADCLVCDRIPGPAFLKRINPLCISCQACRDANNLAHGGGDALDAIESVPKALSFILSYRFLEVIGGGLLVLLGIYLLGKQLGVDVPVPSPAVAAAAAA